MLFIKLLVQNEIVQIKIFSTSIDKLKAFKEKPYPSIWSA